MGKTLLNWRREGGYAHPHRVYATEHQGRAWELVCRRDGKVRLVELLDGGPGVLNYQVSVYTTHRPDGPDWPTKAKQEAEGWILTPAEQLARAFR